MREDLDKALVAAYPKLYVNRVAQPAESCMAWGFDCGDGWYPIINALSAVLEGLKAGAVADQVKEKCGTLRFYVSGEMRDADWSTIYGAVRVAEMLSAVTCEGCGKPGTLRGKGWAKTLCDDCAAEWGINR